MHQLFAVGGLLSAFGLSSAAGLNAALPLLAVGLLSRAGHLDLSSSYTWLRSTPALVILAIVLVVDIVGDKVPAVDHVLHAVGMVAYPVAGAIAFASQAGAVHKVSAPLGFVIGLVTAGGLHVGRASVRPLATAATLGIGNPVLSSVEDVTSASLTALALIVPVVAALLAVGAIWLTWRVLARLRRGWRRVVSSGSQ